MTNPNTEPNIRERLARAAFDFDQRQWKHPEAWDTQEDSVRAEYLEAVDAILAELQEPTEGMLDAVTSPRKFIGHPEADESSRRRQLAGFQAAAKGHWQAMLQHIRDGGK